MNKIISRSLWIQRKFISRYTKVHHYEMVLYNEKPLTSTSLVVQFEDNNKKLYHVDEVKRIKSRNSKTLSASESNYFVLHTNSDGINVPVVEERINTEDTPEITLVDIVKWLAKTPDSDDKEPVQPGTRLGRLDAANEAGFFHRTDRSRLKDIKKKLKDKVDTEPTDPKKSG